MQGIVSLLDAASEQAVRALWNELDRDWNLREGVRSAPIPHISYHVAETYDLTRIGHIPRRVAVETPPLRARIIGLDRFTEHGQKAPVFQAGDESPRAWLFVSLCGILST